MRWKNVDIISMCPTPAHGKRQLSHVLNVHRIIFKLGKNIYGSQFPDEFDYGISGSLNMRMMDHLTHLPKRSILA